MAWCVMVKGPCRGKMCDFWARVRIRKADADTLLEEMRKEISVCLDNGKDIDDAIQGFWKMFGLTDLGSLCVEEPYLYVKIRKLEEQVRSLVS